MNLYEDKIADFLDSCAAANIHDPVSYLLSKRVMVFDWLKGAFPRDILPTDIDGEVEINGRFLRFEFKDESVLRNGHVKKGQRLALMRLVATGFFTVFIVGVDESGLPTCIEIFKSNGVICPIRDVNREEVRELCMKWSAWVESLSRR